MSGRREFLKQVADAAATVAAEGSNDATGTRQHRSRCPDHHGRRRAGRRGGAGGGYLADRYLWLRKAILFGGGAAGAEAAQAACDRVRLITQATSLGGVETTMERRARHALEHPATPASLIRMSVGIEALEDLWADLDQALRG